MPEKSILQEIRTEWFTPEQVAEALDMDVSTVYRWLNSGALSGVQLGKKWHITEADIRAFILDERRRQEYKIRYRNALREVRRELKQLQASEPRKQWEIAACANCGMPIPTEADSKVAAVCSLACAEAMEPV